eukprot:CAMPEP_0205799774 /NCGR_PEP_ID=MMETSP0205-20121125/1188_1 /ASSEMBLY_ACC=CAM_ASM_000278 /TAXON_ID=36767 /ORGANISM="Euplotes focardii, Strain TN1" /LENGTH=123 /DNA_ID=CAMNT_0053061709 /DNA_START=221 /DNA_END=589 /DNA_ORIENTATION=-
MTQIAPYMPLRLLGGFFSKHLIKLEMNQRMFRLDQDGLNAIHDHLCQISLRSGSAENAIHIMFKYNFIPRHPIIESIEELENNGISTCFIYGDSDWLDFQHNGPKVSQILKDEGRNIHILEDS